MVDLSETGFCSPAAAAVHPGDGPGGEAMMGTLKAALRAPALGNKGLINFLNRRAGR